METNNNMKDFNIAEILKYAPKGLKLYSPLFGEVRLEKVSDHDDTIVVTTKYKSERVFFEDGKYDSNGECLLFPSINHRCWNNWQNTLFLESKGSVCVDTITGNKFLLGNDGTYFSDNTGSCYYYLTESDEGNYMLNSRYATPEEAKEFFDEFNKKGYKWDGEKVVKKEVVSHKFKVGDIVKFDRPSAMLKREILSIDFDNERYLTRRTDIGGAIKEFIYFCEQDDYVIVGSHYNNPTLEVKVSMMADEILALKQRVTALEIQAIRQTSDLKRLDALEKLAKDSEIRIDALECGGKPFQCPDKAGDNITLEDMKQ